MATFPSISPTYGVQKRSAPRVRAIQFGSGYQQRAQFGIQQNPKVYNLTFDGDVTGSAVAHVIAPEDILSDPVEFSLTCEVEE